MRTTKEVAILASSRIEYRTKLVNIFLQEEPGTGCRELCSHYIYHVDTAADGTRILLKRPANLNKGFDFEVHVENYKFGTSRQTSRPSHKIILDDLSVKKAENPNLYKRVEKLIDQVFACQDTDNADVMQIVFTTGYPFDVILAAIKWLFIEQDVTYWNWSGRNMLYSAIRNLC